MLKVRVLIKVSAPHSHQAVKNLSNKNFTFTGANNDAEAGREFICSMYLDVGQPKEREDGTFPTPKDIYPHFTCATDTENIMLVFAVVQQTIMKQNLDKYMNVS